MTSPIVFPKVRPVFWSFRLFSIDFILPAILLFIGMILVVGVGSVKAVDCTVGPHSGLITSDQRWCKTDNPHQVTGNINVQAGVTLTIDPGVQVQFATGTSLIISGSLQAVGNADEGIIFTSTGEGVLFRRIQFQAGSSGSMSYCDVTQAGSIQGILWIETSDLVIDHCSIHDTSPTMGAILLNVAGITPSIRDTSILNNSNYAIYQNSPDMAPVYDNLVLSGNSPDAVFITGGNINRNVTWDSREVSGVPFIAGGSFTVSTGATLTLNPATELRFPQAGGTGMGLTVSNGATFLAEGTETEPVRITSTGTGINWTTLNFSNGSTVRLSYCDISQAKNVQGVLSVNTSDLIVDHCTFHDNQPSNGVIWLAAAGITPSISNSNFINNNTYPVYQNSPNMAPILINLTSSGTGTHAIAIAGGGISTGRNWTIGQSGLPARVLGAITVDASGFLALDPGSKLQMGTDVSINVNGGFYALGTTLRPIQLSGISQTPGSWKNLVFNNGSKAILDNVEISYGGVGGQALLRIGTGQFSMQNCKVHHSASDGVQVFNNKQPTLSYNHIYNNDFGLRNQTPTTEVTATYQWWGDPSGPYHSTNPDGLGNAVSDGVIFSPWLDAPTQIGDLPVGHVYVDLVSQTRASPGQRVDYAIWYNNLSTTTITNAILVLSLPDTDFYKSSNAGGIYWPSRHQVFWLLGNLEPGESGTVVIRTEYKWGIPDLTLEASMAIVLGDGLENGQLNPADYLEYVPFQVASKTSLTEGQFEALLPSIPELGVLYSQVTSLGYVSSLFNQLMMSDGQIFIQAVMVKPDISELAFVTGNENGALAYIIGRTDITLINSSGVIRYDPQTMYFYYSMLSGNGSGLRASTNTINCLANCLITETGTSLLLEFLPFLGKVSTAKDCQAAAADPEDKASLAACVAGLSNLPGVGTVVSAVNCFNSSIADPEYCRCTETKWESTTFVRTNVEACRKTPCKDGVYASWDAGVTACPFCTKCLSGSGGSENPWDHCKPTGASAPAECVPPGRLSSEWPITSITGQDDDIFDGMKICLLIPRDPNAKYGEAGDVIPGQEMNYTVTYENEGAGRAYGVYITDTLDEALDESTLSISGDYLYIPASRRIVWFIGELGPKGDPDSKGEVTFTVQLKEDVPGGTAVTNQAIVYFPSAPEITPTNAVVNFVEEVTALPQQLETDYLTPVEVTLQGQDVGGAPLTFSILEEPLFGELTGTIPNLTYTPMENMTGPDEFTYIASNGISTSNPAEVTITIKPSANDHTPPSVLWTFPGDGRDNIPYRQSAAGYDEQGPIFAPFPILQFSEVLDLANLSESDFSFAERDGLDMEFSFTYDEYSNQVKLFPRSTYNPDTWYTIEVSTDILDLSGNPIAEAFSFSFQIGSAVDVSKEYLPIIIK